MPVAHHLIYQTDKFGEDNLKPHPSYYDLKIFSTVVLTFSPQKLIVKFGTGKLDLYFSRNYTERKEWTNQSANKLSWSEYVLVDVIMKWR